MALGSLLATSATSKERAQEAVQVIRDIYEGRKELRGVEAAAIELNSFEEDETTGNLLEHASSSLCTVSAVNLACHHFFCCVWVYVIQ